MKMLLCVCMLLVTHALFSSQSGVSAQGITVTGTVTDKGEPMPGVNVLVKGTTQGVVTDVNGKYSITVPNKTSEIVFSFIGYITTSFTVGDQIKINVALEEDTKQIEEVVVVGYGAAQRKSDLSASIKTVEHIDKLKDRPVGSVTDMLQGQIAGVTITNNGGDPTAGASITIRGQGTRGSDPKNVGESPLWVVDGVPGAPLNFNDVESITVLKDAASAAIYGSQSGSAGVILVTTKRAKAGLTTVTYEGSFGLAQATNLPQSLTIDEEKAVRQIALAAKVNPSALPDGWDPAKNPYIAENRTDWIDEIFRTAFFQRHNLALSGGSGEFANRLSVQYTDRQGTLVSTYNKNLTMRYDASYNISKMFRVREDFHWSNSEDRGTDTESGYSGVILSALMMPRNAEAYYSDGTFGGTAPKDPAYAAQYGSNYADLHGDVVNPLRTLSAATRFHRPMTVSSSTFFDIIEPIKGLKYTGRFTFRLDNYFYKNFNPKAPEPGKPNMSNSLRYEANRAVFWEVENAVNYDRTFGKHMIGALVATSANQFRKKEFNAESRDFINEQELYQYFSWAATAINPDDNYPDPDNNVNLVGRIAYSWNNRYFATASFRRDWAGRLPDGKKYGDFPAVTAAWKLSEESFMPKSEILNLLKFRASWGRIGNMRSVTTAYGNPTLSIESWGDVGGQVGRTTPLVPITVYNGTAFNPFLTWETSETTDFGLDMEFFSHRLSLSADFFLKRTFNLIKAQDLGWPAYMGLDALKINQGEIRNRGLELNIGWEDKAGEVGYFINANMATLVNKIYDIGPADPATGKKPVWTWGDSFRDVLRPYRSREGDPLYTYWIYETGGLFQSDEEAAAYVDKDGKRIQDKAKAGDLKFIDQNGDGKLNDDDRVYKGSFTPKVTYALFGGLNWKGWSFNMMLQGVGGVKAYHANKFITLNESQGNFNRWNRILDAYPNTNDIPRISAEDLNGNFSKDSDWYLENASYLRIKNITLSYTFDALLHNLSAKLNERKSSLTINVGVDNLYTFTKYTGMDPEVGWIGFDGGRYPVSRIFSVGVKLRY